VYLESGPQHKRTWVYVPGLAGCVAFGPTTEQALANVPAAIRERIAFLRRHGDHPPDPEPIEIDVARHVIERKVLGFGQQVFDSDLAPVSPEEAARQLRWAGWSREELIEAARSQAGPLAARPPGGGRSVAAILSHVAGAEWSYVSSTLGTVPGGSAAIAAIEAAGEAPWAPLAAEREVLMRRLKDMTADELSRAVERNGRPPRTARRMLRRMLEHEWEHVLELRARL